MSYEDAFAAAWDQNGPRGALEFLREIFRAPDNQKIQGRPTDYLSDRDDEYVSPAFGFDRMLERFATRWMTPDELLAHIEQHLVESRSDAHDQKHRAQPFNAFLAIVCTYDHGDANLLSVHVSADDAQWKPQYGLYHQLIADEDNYDPDTEDDEDTYDFIYELEAGERYKLTFEDEAIDGELLFKHVRIAQYAVFLDGFVDRLFARELFASFPKVLPFRIFITDDSGPDDGGSTEDWFEVRPAITDAWLSDHPLRDVHLKSAEPPPELSKAEKWSYLLGQLTEPDSSEFADLAALLDEDEVLRAQTVTLALQTRDGGDLPAELGPAWQQVPRTVSPVSWARLFWRLSEDHLSIGADYVRGFFEQELPNVEDFDAAIGAGQQALRRLYGVWDEMPPALRANLAEVYDAAIAAAEAQPHPAMRVMTQEHRLRTEFGDDVAKIARRSASYELDNIPDDYVEAVIACVGAMPDEFPGYRSSWEFVMNRLEALGERAIAGVPAVIEVLNRYCEPGSRDNQEILKFADVLFKMGADTPPERIHEYCQLNQHHLIDCYKEWSTRLPKRRWAQLTAQFADAPDQFESAASWDALLIDAKPALDFFAARLHEADNANAMVEKLCVAAQAPSDVLQRLVEAAARKSDGGGRHKPADAHLTGRVVRLLEALPERSDQAELMLRRSRLLLVRFAIDAGDCPNEEIAELLEQYPDHPMLLFFGAEIDARDRGPAAAGPSTVAAIQTLSSDDLVYRKAFFEFTGASSGSWSAAEAVHGYTAFRWAFDYQQADSYRDGEFVDGQKAMDGDPFYAGFLRLAAGLTAAELEDARREAALEIAFGEELLQLSNAELADRLTPQSWNVTSQICRRLASEPELYVPSLLTAYRWFREDETRRKALVSLLWPAPSIRAALLADAVFHTDLAWLIRRYPGVTAATMARDVFVGLAEAGEHELILEVAEQLPGGVTMSVFNSVELAIVALRAYDRGIAIVDAMCEATSEKKPEYVLLTSNRGVLQYRKGAVNEAEQTFDALFAKDWSRFDYNPGSAASLTATILGGDLDAQIADVFRQYFAMAKFNAACIYANCSRPDDAVAALREAALLNPTINTAAKFEAEDDLAPIRESADYAVLIAEIGGVQ